MNEDRSWDGWWWAPNEYAQRLAGRLRWTPIDGAELDLFGEDPASFDPKAADDPGVPTLHGHGVDGKRLTLFNAFMRRHSMNTAGGVNERWTAPALVIGEHVPSREDFSFTEARVSLRALGTLLDRALPSVPGSLEEPDAAVASIDGARVTVKFTRYDRRRHRHRSQELRPELRLSSGAPIPLDQWRRNVIRPLINLIVLSTGEQSFVEQLVVRRTRTLEVPLPSDAARTVREDVELLEQRFPAGRRSSRIHGGRLLPQGSLTNGLLQSWLELHARLDPAIFFLFGTLNADSTVLENRLVSLTSYVEAYHRRIHSSKGSLEVRIQSLVDRARPVVPRLEPFADHLAQEIVASRTQLVHDKAQPTALEGAKLGGALSRLVIVLLANLVLDLRLPPEAITETIGETYATHSALSDG